jgi:hypothetical protein
VAKVARGRAHAAAGNFDLKKRLPGMW